MRRADRLFRIIQILRSRSLTTAAQLAERLEVSERTIYRDIADLQASGVPVEGAAGVGYVMAAGYDLPPLMFTREEITALVTGARLARAFGGAGTARAAEEALVKIAAVLPPALRARAEAVTVHAIPWGIPADLRDRAERLERLAGDRVKITMTYRDEAGRETARTVRPLGLWFWGKAWTLVAWCELRADFRVFRVDRIAAWEEAGRFAPERDKALEAFYRQQEALGYAPDGSRIGEGAP